MTERICAYCGEPVVADVLEVWGHEFALDTCCERVHEEVVDFLNSDPRAAGKWLSERLRGLLPGDPEVRRAADTGAGGMLLDFQLQLVDTTFAEVRDFIAAHHRHCAPPRGWRFGAAVMNGAPGCGTLVGVVACGRPVARALDQERIVEVNRLCIDPTLPSSLVWNAASMLYGWSAREAKKRGHERIITYTLESESATTLRAAGWKPDHVTQGRGWDTPTRRRDANTSTERKVRWHRQLVDNPVSQLRSTRSPHRVQPARPSLARTSIRIYPAIGACA